MPDTVRSRRVPPIVLLGPQGVQRTLGSVVDESGVSGDIAMFGEGHFAPILLATPAAIAIRIVTCGIVEPSLIRQ